MIISFTTGIKESSENEKSPPENRRTLDSRFSYMFSLNFLLRGDSAVKVILDSPVPHQAVGGLFLPVNIPQVDHFD